MPENHTFLIHIISCQNTTWQGKVTWTEKKESKSFRSMLELIKLIDAAVSTEKAEDGPEGSMPALERETVQGQPG